MIDPKILASKAARRQQLADLPAAEKLRLLDVLHDSMLWLTQRAKIEPARTPERKSKPDA